MAPIPQANIQDLIEWMKRVNDNTLISKLSIPGTHNSAASHLSLPSVQCQGASVYEQLKHGVRFLDVRCATPFATTCGLGASPNDLQVIHGAFPVRLPMPVKVTDLLADVYRFLQEHPSETVLVSLKAEGTKKWQGDEFADIIWDNYINPAKDRWYLQNRVPRIGEARGKAILFRRFGNKNEQRKEYGIDAAWWNYNCEEDDRGTICVQDFCEVMKPDDVGKKLNFVNQHVKRAVQYNSTQEADQNAKLFINFCSGSNFWNPSCWPKKVAAGVNNGLEEDIGKGSGIIIIDYAEQEAWGIVRQLVQLNF